MSKAHFGFSLVVGCSFCAHFWLIGLTAKAHLEFIFNLLVRCPKVILRSFRSSSGVMFGSSVAHLLGTKFFITGRLQIVSLPKVV